MYCLYVTVLNTPLMRENCSLHLHFSSDDTNILCISLSPSHFFAIFFLSCFFGPACLIVSVCLCLLCFLTSCLLPLSLLSPLPLQLVTFYNDQFPPPRCPLPSPPNLTFCTLPSPPIAPAITAPSFPPIPDPRVMWAGRPQVTPATGGTPLLSAHLILPEMIPAQI